jgi:hypothetical protein
MGGAARASFTVPANKQSLARAAIGHSKARRQHQLRFLHITAIWLSGLFPWEIVSARFRKNLPAVRPEGNAAPASRNWTFEKSGAVNHLRLAAVSEQTIAELERRHIAGVERLRTIADSESGAPTGQPAGP